MAKREESTYSERRLFYEPSQLNYHFRPISSAWSTRYHCPATFVATFSLIETMGTFCSQSQVEPCYFRHTLDAGVIDFRACSYLFSSFSCYSSAAADTTWAPGSVTTVAAVSTSLS